MKKKDSSTWSEIKTLDERLARDPDSFCFARLSEIYLKVGLAADALHTARQGVAKHPGYLAGQRALAMACNANGLHEESRALLEQVTAATPEDASAQKLLAHLYVESGDPVSATRVFSTLLDFRPDDTQIKSRLEELRLVDAGAPAHETVPAEPAAVAELVTAKTDECPDQPEVVAGDAGEEEIYELSEDDIVYDDEDAEPSVGDGTLEKSEPPLSSPHHDPLSTQTLAELYEQQGFISKALDIYRSILADDPSNTQLQSKVALLEGQETPAEIDSEKQAAVPEVEDVEMTLDTSEAESTQDVMEPAFTDSPDFGETLMAGSVPLASAAFEGTPAPVDAEEFAPLAHQTADNVVGTLESWLENIRRIKACR